MPSMLRAPDTTRGDTATFFSLGVFSGIASSCCAPVLAGVMTLSALSGNPLGGLVLGLAFVFGMVIPLLVMALVWDAARLNERRWGRAKPIRVTVAGRSLHTNSVNLLVAVAFVVMGVWVITLAGSATMTGSGTWVQLAAGDWIRHGQPLCLIGDSGTGKTHLLIALGPEAAQTVLGWRAPVPEPVLGLALLGLAGVFVWTTLRDRRRDARQGAEEHADADPTLPHCHSTTDADHPIADHDTARN